MYGEQLITAITAFQAVGFFTALSVKALIRIWKSF